MLSCLEGKKMPSSTQLKEPIAKTHIDTTSCKPFEYKAQRSGKKVLKVMYSSCFATKLRRLCNLKAINYIILFHVTSARLSVCLYWTQWSVHSSPLVPLSTAHLYVKLSSELRFVLQKNVMRNLYSHMPRLKKLYQLKYSKVKLSL
jgi:hypothetical protein